ncbi:winged helix-turn-helix transcriptional regulator [Microbacterium sp. RD1]|uniref:winged helix-turn-helix transcriptional regulator n=1 Tax=Microbacterium sp. RD1 TaxID=3457313 RepID=UPI003FA52828
MSPTMHGILAAPDRTELGDGCPIDRASSLLARRSTVLLLREAWYGTSRFDDFVERTGLTQSVVAAQLRHLTEEGLLEKRSYREPGQRGRQEYFLTDAGDELVPLLVAFAAWGDRHLPRSRRLRMVHDSCGADVHVDVRCAAGHDLHDGEIVVSLERTARSDSAEEKESSFL